MKDAITLILCVIGGCILVLAVIVLIISNCLNDHPNDYDHSFITTSGQEIIGGDCWNGYGGLLCEKDGHWYIVREYWKGQ